MDAKCQEEPINATCVEEGKQKLPKVVTFEQRTEK